MKNKKNFGLSERSLELIIETFKKFPEIKEAVLFGSRAMGNEKKGSDIDIALKGEISPDLLLKVKVILEQELPLPYFFDLVDYEHIDKKELKAHIDTFGINLLSSRP